MDELRNAPFRANAFIVHPRTGWFLQHWLRWSEHTDAMRYRPLRAERWMPRFVRRYLLNRRWNLIDARFDAWMARHPYPADR